MLNDNAKKWIEALRSGEFEQAAGALRIENSYCCLGVACELYRRETEAATLWVDNGNGSADHEFTFMGSSAFLPTAVRDWLGLDTTTSSYSGGETASLIDANDAGEPFTKIADIIESEPEGLFA